MGGQAVRVAGGGRGGEAADAAAAAAAEGNAEGDATAHISAEPFRHFWLDIEEQKLRLREFVVRSFTFWVLLGVLLWWWATAVPRAPVPLLQESFFTAGIHAASRFSPASAAFGPPAAAATATAAAAAEMDVAAGAERATAAAATLAAAALQRGNNAAVRPLQPTDRDGLLSLGAADSTSDAAAVASGRMTRDAAASATATHGGAAKEEEETGNAAVSASRLLPPLTLVFGLRLLPLCAAAAEDARLFYRLLLSQISAVKHPLYRSLFSVDEGIPQERQKWQQQEERETQAQSGGGPVTSVEAAFTGALDVVFGGTAATHAEGEAALAGMAGKATTEAGEEQAMRAEAWQQLLLQQSASLSLLRVELLEPLASECTAAAASDNSAAAFGGRGASSYFSGAAGFPRSWPRAAAAVAEENEAALVYTVAFSAAGLAPQSHRQQQKVTPTKEEPQTRKQRQQQEDSNGKHRADTGPELAPPEIVLHAESAATVYSAVASTISSSGPSRAASAAAATAGAAPSSFALHEGAAALYHVLRTTIFRRHVPPAADTVIPAHYELSFWLAGDPPPRTQQQKQQHTDAQQERRERTTTQLPRQSREWARLQWRFQRDVLSPYLLPFFSRMALLFTFPSIQSQVVPLSGIASLLKKAPTHLAPTGSEAAAALSSTTSAAAAVAPAAAAAADGLYVLDVASQHQLQAVSSRWQPQQIVNTPTYFPAPLLNFVYYKPPVPAIILHEVRPTSMAAPAGTQKVLLATYGVSIPGWGAIVVGPPPAPAAAASHAAPSPADGVLLRSVASAAAAFPAAKAAALPSVAAAAASRAPGAVSAEELRYASRMWVAQLRSLFLLPSTLHDYFFSSPYAARGQEGAATDMLEAQERKEEEQRAAGYSGLLGDGWQATLVSDGAGSSDSSSGGGVLVLDLLHRQAHSAENQRVQQRKAAGVARGEGPGEGRGEGEKRAAAVDDRARITAQASRGNAQIRVFVEPAAAGAGLWEVWAVARQVYVQFILQAVRNIYRLQSIITSQPELVVPPHIGGALQRALMLIECSAEAAVFYRICTQLPASLKRTLLKPMLSPTAGGAPTGPPADQVADGLQKQSSSTAKISNARFLFFALALARAALQDSLEVLYDESVAAKSHFNFEFKCAIYLPFTLPFLLPVLVGMVKLRKERKKLSRIAKLTRLA